MNKSSSLFWRTYGSWFESIFDVDRCEKWLNTSSHLVQTIDIMLMFSLAKKSILHELSTSKQLRVLFKVHLRRRINDNVIEHNWILIITFVSICRHICLVNLLFFFFFSQFKLILSLNETKRKVTLLPRTTPKKKKERTMRRSKVASYCTL